MAYRGIVTYSVVLANSGLVSDTGVLLTDTLPVEVDFARWVAQPVGAEIVGDELTWSGTATAGQALTFTFVVSHVGDYGDVVTNTARFSGTQQAGDDSATFTVVRPVTHTVHLPLVVKAYQVLLPVAMTYGGADWDHAYAIQQTDDGGYIMTGETDSFGAGDEDVWVLKLNADGGVAWQRTYGGADQDLSYAIQQTADGGYVVAGYTESYGAGRGDVWVLKLNADGSVAWQKTYGGMYWNSANTIQQTVDGGYIVAGNAHWQSLDYGDAWVLKLNADGNVAWQKSYGGIDWNTSDRASAIRQTADGGYIMAGTTHSFGVSSHEAWVLKLNADGSGVWHKTYGGKGWERIWAIQQTSDGGYVVAGSTDSFGAGDYDAWVLKLNADGSVAWQKTYGGTGSERALAIQQMADGGYVVAGYTQSFGAGSADAWVLKLDANGSVMVVNTDAVPVNSDAMVADSTATVTDTSVTPEPICACPLSFCNRLE